MDYIGGIKKNKIYIGSTIGIIILIISIISPPNIKEMTIFFVMITTCSINVYLNSIKGKREVAKNNYFYEWIGMLYKYVGIMILVMLFIQIVDYRSDKINKIYRLGLESWESISLLLVCKHYGNNKNKKAISAIISVSFFLTVAICLFLGTRIQISNLYYIVFYTIHLSALSILFVIVYDLRKDEKMLREESRSIFFLFLSIKIVYHIFSIFYLNKHYDEQIVPLYLLRFLYSYCLMNIFFYIQIKHPWELLLQQLDDTSDQINHHEEYRNTIINLSHELKTPINVIQSAADLLKLHIGTEKGMLQDVQSIKGNCYQSIKIISNMIDLTKLKGGYIVIKYEIYNIIDILENVVEAFTIYYSKIDVIVNTEQEELYVKLDKVIIQRCMVYLLDIIQRCRITNSQIYIHIQLDLQLNKIHILINNAEAKIPMACSSGDLDNCSPEDTNDMIAIKFVKEIFRLHDISLEISENNHETCMQLILNNEHPLEEEIIIIDAKENIEEILERMKTECYKPEV